MYHHHHHQGKNIHPSSRGSIPPERHLFLQWGNGAGDSGLVLSTDANPRLKWTQDLHERFIEAMNRLGGSDGYSKNSFETYGVRTDIIPLKEPSSGSVRISLGTLILEQTKLNLGMVIVARERMSEANGTYE
ncbi:Myb-related protein 1 [Camellia lanceoleosa]|uniref:Myb-related protein 1 n=1 Tax=Camellia lanceoleosa TaxID=1840588 RepID=A0ACC0G619_9ERIC|nr:Myb-related protein 1 [Camellia lanceoleosa]